MILTEGQFNSVRRRSKRSMMAELSGPAPIKAKLAGKNTLDYIDVDGVRRILLHETNILTIWPDGGFAIDTGGWNTHTTRARLNAFLPAGWRVHTSKGRIHLNATPFLQRCDVTGAGDIIPDLDLTESDKLSKAIDAFMAAWRKRGLPRPEHSKGDPWISAPTENRTGVFGTDEAGRVSKDVMLNWVESQYTTLKLYELAEKYAGISDYGLELLAVGVWRRGGKLGKLQLSRIHRYVRACLGLTT